MGLRDGQDSPLVTAGLASLTSNKGNHMSTDVAIPFKARIIGPSIGPKPEWAKALIVAEFETDESDIMTDYFATSTRSTVPLAWSRHTRDLFSEMRKAAATFKPTRHLGPGCDVWTAEVVLANDIPRTNGCAYYAGGRSHWHHDLYPSPGTSAPKFQTKEQADAFVASAGTPEPISFDGHVATFAWAISCESIEHREKYSMGSGYYLKGSCGYSTGWTVSKTSYDLDRFRS